MAKINTDQFTRSLKSGSLVPIYLICGDEALLQQEAADALRAHARKAGFAERERFHTDSAFNWSDVLLSANSMSLFNDKKCIELRLHNYKIGDAGSKALQAFCESPPEDTLMLLIGPKADRSVQNSKWYKAVEKIGVVATAWPVPRQKLPQWIDQRLQRKGLRADSRALDILAEKVEGNLLAAMQEIEKLTLLVPEGAVDAQTMASVVVDSARYDVFSLVDRALEGDARAASHTLNGLKGEGVEAPVILWALAREIRTLLQLKAVQDRGQSIQGISRQFGVFDQRLPLVKRALNRINTKILCLLLKECGLADRSIKGMSSTQTWNVLLDIILVLSGTRSLNGRSAVAMTAS